MGPRCAWCHDDLDDAARACGACQTLLHADCAALAGVCPTLGCAPSASVAGKARWPVPRSAAHLLVAAAAMVPLLVVAVVPVCAYLFWPVPCELPSGLLGWGGLPACADDGPAPADPDRLLRAERRALAEPSPDPLEQARWRRAYLRRTTDQPRLLAASRGLRHGWCGCVVRVAEPEAMLNEWAPLRLETDAGEVRVVLGNVEGRPYGFAAPRGRDELRWFE